MTPLFSKVDSNKLWHDVQHEENVIYAQFGKDLFNISKVIGRKKWPSFFDSQCISWTKHCQIGIGMQEHNWRVAMQSPD